MGAEQTVVSLRGTSSTSSDEHVAPSTILKGPVATVDTEAGLRRNLRDDDDSRAAFLSEFSATESKAIMSKVDRRFFILIGLMFMIKNLDNSNASLIKVLQVGQPSNILKELKMSANEYNWVASTYGIAYITFEFPSTLVLKKFTPHVWQSRIFICWGIATACSGAVHTKAQLLACRFLVGLFEAGMFPSVITQLTFWYRTDEFSRPMVWFFALSNLSGLVGSLLCYGISYMDGVRGLSSWRWVFIIEGVTTVIFGGLLFWLLPDFPKSRRSSSWLSSREQEFIEARLPRNAPTTGDKNFDKKDAWHAFRSPLVWSFTGCQGFMNLASNAFSWYLPTIITSLGFAGLPRNQLLNIPPVVAAVLGIIFSSWFIGRAFVSRPLYISFMVLGSLVSLIILMTAGRDGKFAACILGSIFINSFYPPYWSWRAGYVQHATGAAFALGLQSTFSNISSVVSPHFYQSKWAKDGYRQSFGISLGMAFGAGLSVLYSWWLTRKVEAQVVRVRREVLKAQSEGREYDGHDDIDVLGDETLKNRRLW
ncbi:hypothetical protein A1O3_07563 [Capronia epimyces CBS 606.96]|uniref:Major facilitator superfamily (MFS) profile domain-containing protein n=1 Tax=Capronia epimyces CBS 606.96 TaxID=1182542 RepID=W9XM20_9EURO|nr:uncharacterized protein A1O3_07563 [Capronia epimyces CBS 606.96]EXJ81273.1 hypothetical protein A1O3_07563 [Capronia epimyces CBS 606.96]